MAATHGIRKPSVLRLIDELRPSSLAASLIAGMLTCLLEIVLVISFAALIFSGHLADQLPQALGFILAGNVILVGAIALFSSYRGSVGVAQDVPAAVLGVSATTSVAVLSGEGQAQQFATVAMMIVVTTLMTGALFLVLGIFKLGGLARFLPYPVMGGFLAGTGWLLVKGGLGIMVTVPSGGQWLSAPTLLHWLPGAMFGLALFAIGMRFRHALTLPILLALGTLIFYGVVIGQHIPMARLSAEGWLVGSIPAGSLSHLPLSVHVVSQVNWPVLLRQIPDLAPVAIISVIALLLNCGGLELVAKQDIDLNRELVVAGVGNLAGGALGGLVGYPALSLSTLNYRMTGGERVVGVLAALLVGVPAIFDTQLVAYFPKVILGAVVVYLGIGLLVEWIYEAWFKFPKVDFLIIVSVMAVIAASGFLNGLVFGLLVATILFVVSYSRVSIVKFALSATDYRSRVTRGAEQQQLLDREGDHIYILKLQGFVFFGTANSLFDGVREQAHRASMAIQYVLLDFAQVSGMDSTGLLSFTRMWQWAQEQGMTLVLTGLNAQVREQFVRGGCRAPSAGLRFFGDLDHGLQWCEDNVIATASAAGLAPRDLVEQLEAVVRNRDGIVKLVSYLHRQKYAPGEYVIRQGDTPDMIYFIESGQVSAQLEAPGQEPVRLEAMAGGRAVGELGFVLGIRRTAAVIVDTPSVIYTLSMDELTDVARRDPESASLFYRILAYLLAERVVHLTRVVGALER